jgi:hypothetical protein
MSFYVISLEYHQILQNIRLLNQQQVARMYDVFGRWILSSKCYLAAFIAITAFLKWPNIIIEFSRNLLWNINDIRAVVSDYYKNRLTLI